MRLQIVSAYDLFKSYSILLATVDGQGCFIVASEKNSSCLLFDLEGNFKENIWNGPGGTMSLVDVPQQKNSFLASQEMYSPDDARNAKIVLVTKTNTNTWDVQVLAHLPFVHRFGLIACEGKSYVVACTIKSDSAFEGDWSSPGQVFVAEFDEDNANGKPLIFTLLLDNVLKNHGFSTGISNGIECVYISSEYGVYLLEPPHSGKTWKTTTIIDDPISDLVFIDLDNDGVDEIVAITPFHGDTLTIYHKKDQRYIKYKELKYEAPFSHAFWGGRVFEKNICVIGYREGKGDIIGITYELGDYKITELANNAGAANFVGYVHNTIHYLASTNRENDQVCLYKFIK